MRQKTDWAARGFKTGAKFGKLEQVSEVYWRAIKRGAKTVNRPHCRVRCRCGQEYESRCSNLQHVRACYRCSRSKPASTTRIRRIWTGILYRCTQEHSPAYRLYGARGITVCDTWKNSRRAFIEWALENGYRDGLSIDRIDNDKGYSPDNCRWVTIGQQSRNKRTTIRLTAFGETKPLVEWAEDSRCRVTYSALYERTARWGWAAEEAIATPPCGPGPGSGRAAAYWAGRRDREVEELIAAGGK